METIDWTAVVECNEELFNPEMRVRIKICEAAQNFIMNGQIEMTTEASKALAVFMLEVKGILAQHRIEQEPEKEEG